MTPMLVIAGFLAALLAIAFLAALVALLFNDKTRKGTLVFLGVAAVLLAFFFCAGGPILYFGLRPQSEVVSVESDSGSIVVRRAEAPQPPPAASKPTAGIPRPKAGGEHVGRRIIVQPMAPAAQSPRSENIISIAEPAGVSWGRLAILLAIVVPFPGCAGRLAFQRKGAERDVGVSWACRRVGGIPVDIAGFAGPGRRSVVCPASRRGAARDLQANGRGSASEGRWRKGGPGGVARGGEAACVGRCLARPSGRRLPPDRADRPLHDARSSATAKCRRPCKRRWPSTRNSTSAARRRRPVPSTETTSKGRSSRTASRK